MSIPKIIHRIAPKDRNRWHPIWERCYLTWQQHFPNFEHKMWNDEEGIDNLVKEHYPHYWETYQLFPAHINRLDFVRFCILHKFGGIYADMDMFCYRNFYDDLTHSLHIVEAPYGEEFLESSLMISQSNHNFWIDCMESSQKQFNEQVKTRKITVPFNNDRAIQYILQSVAGPNLICKVWKKWHNTEYVKTLPGIIFNNHGMSYHSEYRTKHMMTGMWGKESLDYLIEHFDTKNIKQELGHNYIKEMQNYVALNDITVDTFDFFHDYTNGGMKTWFVPNIENVMNESVMNYD